MALDIPESHRDLLDADVGVFATLDGGGLPQLTVVWFLLEDGEVRLSFNSKRAKTHNLRARQECSLAIVDLANPYRYLELRGRPGWSRTTTTPSLPASERSTTRT